MHLQPDQMAQAVREERRAHTGGQRRFRRYVEHAEILQDAHEREVRVDVQLLVIHAGTHTGPHLLLGSVHRVDQGLELVMAAGRIGARDVAGVAVGTGTGVDQEAAQRGRRAAAQVGVVQHGGMFVEADDVAVR